VGCALAIYVSQVCRGKHTLHFWTARVMWIRWFGESGDDSPSILERNTLGVGIFQGNYSSEHPRFEPFNRDRFVVLLLQPGRRHVRMGRRGNGMEGRELGQSVKKYLLLPLSNAVVQMLGHGNRTQRTINDLGLLQVLLSDDGLCEVAVGPFRLGSGSVSNDNVRTLGFGELLPLGAFGEVFFLNSPCFPPSEGCDLDNSGRVERALRARRGDSATKRPYSDSKGSAQHLRGTSWKKPTSHSCSQHRCWH